MEKGCSRGRQPGFPGEGSPGPEVDASKRLASEVAASFKLTAQKSLLVCPGSCPRKAGTQPSEAGRSSAPSPRSGTTISRGPRGSPPPPPHCPTQVPSQGSPPPPAGLRGPRRISKRSPSGKRKRGWRRGPPRLGVPHQGGDSPGPRCPARGPLPPGEQPGPLRHPRARPPARKQECHTVGSGLPPLPHFPQEMINSKGCWFPWKPAPNTWRHSSVLEAGKRPEAGEGSRGAPWASLPVPPGGRAEREDPRAPTRALRWSDSPRSPTHPPPHPPPKTCQGNQNSARILFWTEQQYFPSGTWKKEEGPK
ncbi:uncharacterized protein LOC141493054 [Macrotis lagotis]|uniref:uncharacterized protein LOC141493054 n=1 Tax=Macrotis lagotis TaxID=92651 RepID=UPI003D69228B